MLNILSQAQEEYPTTAKRIHSTSFWAPLREKTRQESGEAILSPAKKVCLKGLPIIIAQPTNTSPATTAWAEIPLLIIDKLGVKKLP